MKTAPLSKLYYAVLNMGLGHASRSLPLLQALQQQGVELLIGSNGRALAFLQAEMPGIAVVETPDYDVTYSNSKRLWPVLAAQMPRIARAIRAERRFTRKIVQHFQPQCIVSDHCYGAHAPRIPSFFISHQIAIAMPAELRWLQTPADALQRYLHRHFQRVLIPDLPTEGGGVLSGPLSHFPEGDLRYCYVGWLASAQQAEPEPLDLLVSISGPEPQRSLLEQRILGTIERIPGKKVVVLGKSDAPGALRESAGLSVYGHLPRERMNHLLNGARMLVSRPGYTTLMEIAQLGTKALFVPTPGQTEQHLLAERMRQQGYYYTVDQEDLDLQRDIAIAQTWPGMCHPGQTSRSVAAILKLLITHPQAAF